MVKSQYGEENWKKKHTQSIVNQWNQQKSKAKKKEYIYTPNGKYEHTLKIKLTGLRTK